MKKIIHYILTAFLLVGVNIFAQTVTAPSGAGTSVGDPYLIATLNNLYWVSTNVSSSSGKFYKQTADIDASSTSGWFSGAGWVAIGSSFGTSFQGDYDGNNFAVDGLFISRSTTDNLGLFGYTNGATIQNLGVTNVDISGQSSVGGLVGHNYSSTVTKCYSTGSVNGTTQFGIGGLIGYNDKNSPLSNSFSTCNVDGTGTSQGIGGLVGVNNLSATITNCYSTGTVNGVNRVGGLVGYDVNTPAGSVSKSYSAGSVSGTSAVGGVAGTVGSTLTSALFWDTQTSGLSTSAGGAGSTGKTTTLMKTQSTFTDSTWDFTGETVNGTNDYWTRDDNKNGGYPYLSWQTFPNSVTFTDGSSFTTTPTAGQTNQPIGRLALNTNTLGSVFDGIWVKLNGTRTGLSNFKLWESSDNSFNAASDTQIGSTVAADPGDGNNIWFLSLYKALSTSDKYYFITCDIASDATGSIQAFISVNKEIMLGFSTLNSTITNSALSSSVEPLPVELTSFSASVVNNSIQLNWRTETEINNYGFEIERARLRPSEPDFAEASWETLGFVAGNGTSNTPHNYSFVDNNLLGGVTFYYRLKQIDVDGKFEYSDILTVVLATSQKAELMQNSPNPFNPSTSIKFFIPLDADVTIKIYDVIGREVITLIQEQTKAGFHIVFWNGRNSSGRLSASGIYFYRLHTNNGFVETKKMTFLK